MRLPPKRVWDSWYDRELVTREGEDILASYDSWAIQELSRLKLIWKSWGPITSLSGSIVTGPGMPSFGLRKVICKDPIKLRLFFLSLLWRAAKTDRFEFQDIQLDEKDLGRLQRMVRDGDPNPNNFYPTTLLQIASRGPTHNFAPIAVDETIDKGDGTSIRHCVFRFYFNGLIANMHRFKATTNGIESFVVGCSPEIVVQTQLIDDSFQLHNLIKGVKENRRILKKENKARGE